MILNLHPSFNPWKAPHEEQIAFEAFTFPGGEVHIRLLPHQTLQGEHVRVSIRLDNLEALGLLMVAIDALKRSGIASFELFIPYFPGARQDRVMAPGEPLTAKVYANLINQLGAEAIYILDPHSPVTPALVNRAEVINNHAFIAFCLEKLANNIVLVAPDAGAEKKLYDLASALSIPSHRLLFCSKKRDVITGALSDFVVHADELYQKSCLIVDDICDRGGTFMGLSKALKEKGAGTCHLAVTHGIFSKGIEPLAAEFERMFTTNSIMPVIQHWALTIYPIALGASAPRPAFAHQ
jgi:ribose-phosphate pyrophosphokinase